MNIAEKLIQLRNERGVTQEELANLFKISVTAIRNYENIKSPRTPKNKVLLQYAKEFDVSLEYLLDDTLNNRKQENISLEKEFGLSDKAIDTLKELNKNDDLNKLFEDKEKLKKIMMVYQILEGVDYFEKI